MLRQESRRTRLRRIKRYGNKAFQSARRTPMTFETIPLGDQTDDRNVTSPKVSSASDQMRIFLLISRCSSPRQVSPDCAARLTQNKLTPI
nr:unnamed protein product [Spirometra erinaceieuropaei]